MTSVVKLLRKFKPYWYNQRETKPKPLICIFHRLYSTYVALVTKHLALRDNMRFSWLDSFYYLSFHVFLHTQDSWNKQLSEIRAPLAAVANQWGQNRQTSVLCEQKAQNVLIHAPHTHIATFWHISDIPQGFHSQICNNTQILYMAAIFVKYCYTTGSSVFKQIYVVRVLTTREK